MFKRAFGLTLFLIPLIAASAFAQEANSTGSLPAVSPGAGFSIRDNQGAGVVRIGIGARGDLTGDLQVLYPVRYSPKGYGEKDGAGYLMLQTGRSNLSTYVDLPFTNAGAYSDENTLITLGGVGLEFDNESGVGAIRVVQGGVTRTIEINRALRAVLEGRASVIYGVSGGGGGFGVSTTERAELAIRLGENLALAPYVRFEGRKIKDLTQMDIEAGATVQVLMGPRSPARAEAPKAEKAI